MKIERTNPPSLTVTKADAKPIYAQVVTVEGAGRLIYTAGQVSTDAAGNLVGRGDLRAQFVQVMENLSHCLAAGGGGLSDIVKVTTYVVDIDDFRRHRDLRASYFGSHPPASSTVQVARLATPDFLIEIEAVAMLGPGTQ